jgi:hypothetical protein
MYAIGAAASLFRSPSLDSSGDGLTRASSTVPLGPLRRPDAVWLLAVGVGLLSVWGALALIHLGDRYALNSSSSVWMGLAEAALRGVLIPPIVDGDYYGGTRYLPLSILPHAGLSAVTGEYLVAGKLLGLLSTAVLGGLLFAVMRRESVEVGAAVAITAVVLASPVGAIATYGMRPEAIPAALELAAVALVARSAGRRAVVVAGVLAALALGAKLTAAYAVVAIAIWLIARDRRELLPFGTSFGVCLVVEILVFDRLTDGRIWANLAELGAGVPTLREIVSTPPSFVLELTRSPSVFLLLPAAATWYPIAWSEQKLSVFHVAFLISLAITFALYTDPGVSYNHLLEPFTLAAVLVGGLWAWARRHEIPRDAVRIMIGASLAMGATVCLVAGPGIDLALAVRHFASGSPERMYGTDVLDDHLSADVEFLADDAWIPLAYDQRPIVLDSYMLGLIGERLTGAVDPLVARINGGEFGFIVLQFDVEDPEAGVERGPHTLGPAVDSAIRDRYRLVDVVRTKDLSFQVVSPVLYVYVPR